MGTVWWASGEGPLAAYAAGYRCELERRGFSPRAVRDRMEVAGQLDRWLAAEGVAAARLPERLGPRQAGQPQQTRASQAQMSGAPFYLDAPTSYEPA
jgi:hypothetical protein